MALGSRQNCFAFLVTSSTTGVSTTVTVDRPFLVNRLKFWPATGVLDVAATPFKIRIQAEGELFYSGLDLPLQCLAIKTEDSAVFNTQQCSPYVLQFDRPITISKDYPLTITCLSTTGTPSMYIIGEGP